MVVKVVDRRPLEAVRAVETGGKGVGLRVRAEPVRAAAVAMARVDTAKAAGGWSAAGATAQGR